MTDPILPNTGDGIEPGDIVSVEGGRFRGCILTYVGVAPKAHPSVRRDRYLVINDTYGDCEHGHITVPAVALVRKGSLEYVGTRAERGRRWIERTR